MTGNSKMHRNFSIKPSQFYKEGIGKLPHRWEKCVRLGGRGEGGYVEKEGYVRHVVYKWQEK